MGIRIGLFGRVVITVDWESGGYTFLFRCLKCGTEFVRKGDWDGCRLGSMVACDGCGYQYMVAGSYSQKYLVNPNALKGDAELCQFGCHYQEPYGFVPMIGCPVHD